MPQNVVEAKGIKDSRQELREAHSGRSMVIMEVPPTSGNSWILKVWGDLKDHPTHKIAEVGKITLKPSNHPPKHHQGHHCPMSPSATSTQLLNPSRDGDSNTARAGSPFWDKNLFFKASPSNFSGITDITV